MMSNSFNRTEVRRVITNAYYDCRNEGETMETAADRAADAVMAIYEQAKSPARDPNPHYAIPHRCPEDCTRL